jgi:glucose/arabinose dehydrogenase
MAMSVCVLAALLSIQAGDKPGEEQGEVWRNFDVPAAPALSPEEQLASFQVADGFRVELVAAEPLVVDPVFAQFDGEGRLWVVEMRGFMPNVDGVGEDAEIGSIAVLEDTDGDGRMDKRTTFLDELVMPRALCLVDGGALVLEPPYLWFCQDADGDLKCEARNRVLDGFEAGLANPEHAPNQLMWSLDNRLYMAKHGKSYSWDGTELHAGPGVGAGQWGMAEDDWGRKYTNHNSWPLFADLVPAHYLRRNGALGKAFGGASRVCRDQDCYSSRVNLGVNRAYRSGTLRDDGYLRTWTGACGPLVYRGTRFPEPYRGSAFVCEPCGNFVHACALDDRGNEIVGTNPLAPTSARAGAEFLTSTDERFRPVNLTAGPDGALYVVDLYRGILQHRVFMTTQLRKQVLERGLDQPVGLGRIWRVVPIDDVVTEVPALGEMDAVDAGRTRSAGGRLRDASALPLGAATGRARSTAHRGRNRQQLGLERMAGRGAAAGDCHPPTVGLVARRMRATGFARIARRPAVRKCIGSGPARGRGFLGFRAGVGTRPTAAGTRRARRAQGTDHHPRPAHQMRRETHFRGRRVGRWQNLDAQARGPARIAS